MYRAAAYIVGGRGKVESFLSTMTTTTTLRDVARSLSSGAVLFPSDTTVLLCSNVPVEPGSSAAGVRTAYLLERLVASPGVTSVHFASPNHQLIEEDESSTSAADWKHKGVQLHELPPNQSVKARELLLNKIPNQHGEDDNLLVIFDRFYSEEMYSFHLHEHRPQALLVLDMQDLHSLRGHRQHWIQQKPKHATDCLLNLPLLPNVPGIRDAKLLRELASIHRSDLTLVCSSVELDLLSRKYQIPADKLCLAPLFGDLPTVEEEARLRRRGFGERSDFVFVGGFRHAPNVDAVRQLKRLWPRIREQVHTCRAARDNADDSTTTENDPVKLHVYGAYCSDHLRGELHDPTNGFLVHGFSPLPVDDLLADRRVMLSPIRFGAGIKGKHVDAWKNGMPVVTTPIGSEGMMTMGEEDCPSEQFGGIVAKSDDEFIQAASVLYNDRFEWKKKVSAVAGDSMSYLCGRDLWNNHVGPRLAKALENRQHQRESDYMRSIVWQQSVRSSEYFSKYIEMKEKHLESTRRIQEASVSSLHKERSRKQFDQFPGQRS